MCSVILSANRRPVSPEYMALHPLHIMPYTMSLQIQVNVLVTLTDPIGPFMCVAEQFVTNLQVLQYRRLDEYVPASLASHVLN